MTLAGMTAGRTLLRAGIERLDERGVGDVVAEGGKPELARLELDVGRAEQAARGIDDADGFRAARRARASRSQTPSAFSRSTELVSSAAVRVSRARALDGAGAARSAATSAPTWASASAAASPAGPVPTTATSRTAWTSDISQSPLSIA